MIHPPYYDEHVETLPRPDLERMQEGLLMQLVPYVHARSSLVRQVWGAAGVTPADIRSLQDFRDKVPFIDKDTIRRFRDEHADPYGGLKCVDGSRLRAVGFTSGTTGDPTPLPFFDSVTTPVMRRDFWHMGMRPGDYMVIDLFTFREGHSACEYTDCDFRVITFQHSPAELPRMLKASVEYRPKVLFPVSAPLLMAMERLAHERDLDLKRILSSYEAVVFGGETPSPRIRQLVEAWGLDLYQITSLGDVTSALDCSAHAGFHAWEDVALVECLDPESNEPVPDGTRGELVVTSLQDDVAPLVRYRTDDLVTLHRERCACGRTHARIHVLGRKGDELLVDGKSVLPRDITPIAEDLPETRAALYQVIRTSRQMDVLSLRMGYAPDALKGSLRELAGRLQGLIGERLGVPVSVELTPDAELLKLGPPHKIPRVTKS